MADDPKHVATIEAAIFSEDRFTYGGLCKLVPDSLGRLPDKLIQRYRKKGLIEYEREGAATVWRLTDSGRAEKARRDGDANG